MMYYPPAKINIGLSIVEKRPDGFHNIETVFYPIALCDRLTVEPAENDAFPKLNFSCTGIALPDSNPPSENLCCKAYRLLDADHRLPPANIHLHKEIPAGAGLGGGSSDAASALKALNTVFQLNLDDEALTNYACKIGSDCAFFMRDPSPAFGRGKGDLLEPVNLSLSGFYLLLVKPPVFVSTADAYASAMPQKPDRRLPDLLQAPVSEWRHAVFNDFEPTVFKKFPEIGKIKEKLYGEGAVYASMSGSGSTVFGMFSEKPDNMAKMFDDCFVWLEKL